VVTRLDNFVLGIFQRFAHWFQKRTGKTNFFLSRLSALLAVKMFLGAGFYSTSSKPLFLFGKEVLRIKPDYVWVAIAFVLLIDAFWLSKQKEGKILGELAEGTFNRREQFWAAKFIRIFSLLTAILTFFAFPSLIVGTLLLWPLIAWLFFDNCVPLLAPRKIN